ncbi:SPOR domain-containing protein [Pantanalinema rosaneae CENA516]|uniref:SPOR domain-containing protein n=1 Tax=Pantanalinema rosaneae TaxID=1620701 RepID=UPI003D70101B
MPQNSTVTSPARSSQARVSDMPAQDGLHPVLRNALVCMDVQLEEELARYRRQKASGGRTIAQMSRRKSAPKTLDLLDFSSPELPTQPPSSPQAPTTLATGISDAIASETLWEPTLDVHSAPTQPSPVPDDSQSQLIPHLPNLEPEAESLEGKNSDRPWDDHLPISHHLTAPPDIPDDYLESSEELLRSLAETEADIEVEQSFMQNLLTPLGLGSMLLLLVSSAIFGYVIMNPSSLSQLFATRSGSKSVLNPPTTVTPPNGANTAQPPEPNLAAREFPEINPANLGTLKAEPGATSAKPATKPGAKSAGNPTARSTDSGTSETTSTPAPIRSRSEPPAAAPEVYSPPEPAVAPDPPSNYRTYAPPARESSPPPPVVQPAPPVQRSEPPAPAVAPQAVAPAPSPATGSDAYPYKIGIPYQNDQSLEAARKVVPDAFVRNGDDGAKVQVGASGSQADAEARAQELRNQGIPAEVYKP